jgi:hypothetical protein
MIKMNSLQNNDFQFKLHYLESLSRIRQTIFKTMILIETALFGIVKDDKDEQSGKQLFPIEVALFGIIERIRWSPFKQ